MWDLNRVISPEPGQTPYYVLKTLGCKANLYDSQLIEVELQRKGWRPMPDAASGRADAAASPLLCIVNSCTVTDEADRQSRKLASRLGRENPAARVVVTGCGAEVDPERLARSQGIHYVVGNQDKPRMVELILEKLASEAAGRPDLAEAAGGEVLGGVSGYAEMLSRHPIDREWPLPEASFIAPPAGLEGHAGKTRAFVKIQEGCNSFCTYCVIPYGRGPSRSLRPREALAHARALVDQGVREIVITGTNIGDYGADWGMDPERALAELFELVLSESGLERLRVGSLDPVEISPSLVSLMARDPRFCAHFHVSLQAAHPRILRLMKRKYGLAQVRDCLRRISELPGQPFVGMDVITGFPGETIEEFEAGYEELASLPWSRLHVFPYSERAGTPATRLPGSVDPGERTRRARMLNALSLSRMRSHYERAGDAPLQGILLERPQKRAPEGASAMAGLDSGADKGAEDIVWANGYTANYLRVLVPMRSERAEALRNQLVSAQPLGVVTDSAAGEASFVARLLE